MTHWSKVCLIGFVLVSILLTPCLAAAEETSRLVSKKDFSITSAQSTYLRQTLTRSQLKELSNIGATLAVNRQFEAVEERWVAFVKTLAGGKRQIDVEALVRWVVRESYTETSEQLKKYSERMSYFNQQKMKMSEELDRAKDHLEAWTRSSTFETTYSTSVSEKRATLTRITTKEDLAAYVKQLEVEWNVIDDNAQLATVDFQNFAQKRTQTLNTLSNIMDLLSDTAETVLRNIK